MAKKDDAPVVTTWIAEPHDHGTPAPAVEVVTEPAEDAPSE
jgi:hypothetical protein